ncbi:protocadherin gamma-C4-like [Argopecten irradians]|uniref:protocadherin gamma-C4-like n=1 Tax=Argopecten irradians TaxID=31199 RepID=UPI00371E4D04
MEFCCVSELFVMVFMTLWYSSAVVLGQGVDYYIPEGDQTDRFIGNVASDARLQEIVDDTEFRNLRYSFLTTGSEYASLFSIDEHSSFLYTVGALDRETICEFSPSCEVNLDVAAQSTMGSFFRKIKVTIYIQDVNDNAPIFDKPSISLTISEAVLGGTSITIDGARDRDTSDQYSLQSYNVTPSSSPFSIKFLKNLDGTSIVQLVVTQPLDREKQDFYQITVIAKDGGNPPKSGTLQANISISDVNDNSPTFESSSYNITVREDINVSTVIMVVSASDLDKGRNGEVVYRLSPHQEVTNLRHFGINNRTGELSILQPIQYIPGQVYRIIVEASDRGEQPLTSQTFVHVSVIDVGNSRPVITTNLLSGLDIAKISEFADLGAVVAHIAVEDPNSGRNGEIDCWAEADAFTLKRLDAKEFKIVVSESLDREVREQHEVKVMCHDNGNPPLNDSDSFLVIVDDVNDSPPIFSSLSYHEEVYENNAFGEVLVQVHASDSDIGHNAMVLYYSLPDNNFVNVEALSGIIRANMSFDREATPTIKFEVLAIDQGQPALTGTATVTLTIKDINDEPPMFNKPVFTFDISENKHAGTNVAQIVATDRDEGDNSKIAYSIVSGQNQMIPFFLFPNGQIKSDRELDREVQSVYDFIVQAEDLGRPSLNSSARVKVIVTDENDNVPVITAPSTTNNTISLTSNTEIGTRVTIIRAFDLDEKENGLIRYFITQRNDSDLFELNEKTGSLILKRKISQKPGETIVLDIMASDQGKPRLTSTRMLFIQITSPAYYTDTIQRNVIIVIILLAVTAICSGAIIIIICVLRRNDRERKDKEKEIYKQATSLEGGVSVFSLPGDDSSLAEKKKKKEVSFSLDDEDMLQIADPNQLSSKNNNLSLDKPFESKTFPKKQDDDHSIVSGDTNASDSGRGGSDDENHAPKPPHTTSTFHDPIPQKSWFEFQRPQNREMQTFSLHRPGPGSPSTSSKPNSYRDFLPNSVSNVQIHVTAEKTNRPKNGLNNMSFDSGKFSPAPTLDISQDYRDCVV